MADPGSRQGAGASTGRGSTGMPRWVKVSVLIAVVLLVAVGVTMFVSGGSHGPGRHVSSAGFARAAPVEAALTDTRPGVAVRGPLAPHRDG